MPSNRCFIYLKATENKFSGQPQADAYQLVKLAAFAHGHHLAITGVFIDANSSHEPNAEQFNAMLERIERRETDHIVAWEAVEFSHDLTGFNDLLSCVKDGKLESLKFYNPKPFERS